MALEILDIIAVWDAAFSASPSVNTFIELAKSRTSAVAFGDRYTEAVALRALHMNAMNDPERGANVGAIVAEKEGELSRNYGASLVTSQQYPDLAATKYGVMLIELIKCTIVPIVI